MQEEGQGQEAREEVQEEEGEEVAPSGPRRALALAALAAALIGAGCGGDDPEGGDPQDPGQTGAPAAGEVPTAPRGIVRGRGNRASDAELAPFRDCLREAGAPEVAEAPPTQEVLDARVRCSAELPPAAKQAFDESRRRHQERERILEQLRSCAEPGQAADVGRASCARLRQQLERTRPRLPRG
jgi:hypothetical protein